MPALYEKVQLVSRYPELGCFTLFHSNGQEFREHGQEEKITDFLEIKYNTPIQVFVVEPVAGFCSNSIKVATDIEPMQIITGSKNYFQLKPLTKEKRKYGLSKKNPFKVSLNDMSHSNQQIIYVRCF